jgi:DNA-binding NtrC family response regulator
VVSKVDEGNELLLIVDDEATLRALMCESLGEYGYRVESCGSAAEALRRIREGGTPINLVISDQTMPGMSGSELSDELQRSHPDLPLILCSGLDVPGHVDSPTRRFCSKPADLQTLAGLVRKMLDRST